MSSATLPPQPAALPVNLAGIPDSLKVLPQWTLWRFIRRKGDWVKMPFQPNGQPAKADDPQTWSTFDAVAAAYQERQGFWSGVGFEFAPEGNLIGVDFDGCLTETGAFAPWTSELRGRFASPDVPDPADIIKQLASYAEVSPSGRGVKLIGIGRLPGKQNRIGDKACGVEFYSQGRYFCLTGHRVPGSPAEVCDVSDALGPIYAGIFGADAKGNGKPHSNGSAPTDDEILRAIGASRTCDKVTRLLAGDTAGFPSPSEADLALASHLAFWTRDAGQVERMMRTSLLSREKWSRDDYLQRTISKALATVTESYDWGHHRVPISGGSTGPKLTAVDGRTEVANGTRLAKKHGGDVRWCDVWAKWLAWDGKRWAIDQRRALDAYAKGVCRDLWNEIGEFTRTAGDSAANLIKEMIRFAKASGGSHGVDAIVRLARSEPGIPIMPDTLDADPWALNCDNGTLDLRTATLRPHSRADCITKLCPVPFDPGATCPLWCEFLRKIMAGDETLIAFLRRAVGMSLTGVVRDHVLLFLHGGGSNGKSTFINTLLALMGPDYGMKGGLDLLMLKNGEVHPTERADLAGKRFAACVESTEGRRLAESLVKELTGGDPVRARRMREDFWQFQPTHKIWLASNHKPSIRGTDHAMWRRIKLVPFTVQIPDADQDHALPEKLKGELPGILAWAVRGCMEWQEKGLGEPNAVRAATDEYRVEEDVLGQFLEARCELGEEHETAASILYEGYRNWAEAAGEATVTQTAFGRALRERGFAVEKGTRGCQRGRKLWRGVGLR